MSPTVAKSVIVALQTMRKRSSAVSFHRVRTALWPTTPDAAPWRQRGLILLADRTSRCTATDSRRLSVTHGGHSGLKATGRQQSKWPWFADRHKSPAATCSERGRRACRALGGTGLAASSRSFVKNRGAEPPQEAPRCLWRESLPGRA